jgi:nicotinamidase/pyrazinamidase
LSLRPGDALLQGRAVFATRDWHPPDHGSFQTHGGSWPVHCVAGTRGAELAPGLALPPAAEVISKGTSPNEEAYSGFQGTDLAARLRQRGCRRVFIGGLATEYCVRATALDAVAEGFDVVVLHDAVRAVDVKQGDGECALAQLIARGVRVLSSAQVLE